MAELATLARPYANAAFDIAQGSNRLDEWSRALAFLAMLADVADVRAMIDEPTRSAEEKAHKLVEIAGDVMTDATRRFVHVLAQNRRLPLLGEIEKQYEVLKAEAERTLDVVVTTAVALSEDETQKIAESLKQRFQQEISLATEVDETLLGGAVIRAGDNVIDGSIRGKLGKLAETLQRV